ncbi:MAG: leucyl/phenylalanyl-tRNA--protein transferase [Alphaproteobacteria bacterium]|nr:MAG: leucyl/phenylalanyl-tRNA--protein transferase [Alphaproteobacteria bacterium]
MTEIDTNLLLNAYAEGIFPMAEDREDKEVFWVDPKFRGVLPLDALHVPKRLARRIRRDEFQFSIDRAFHEVIHACSLPARGRHSTWISGRIESLYSELFERGFAHSVEVWKEGELAGGLYGVSLRAAFFGESMFSRQTDASKAGLVFLVAILRRFGFQLLDTQFLTEHLAQFGVIEIPRADYKERLNQALHSEGVESVLFSPSVSPEASSWFDPSGSASSISGATSVVTGATLLQSINQTS